MDADAANAAGSAYAVSGYRHAERSSTAFAGEHLITADATGTRVVNAEAVSSGVEGRDAGLGLDLLDELPISGEIALADGVPSALAIIGLAAESAMDVAADSGLRAAADASGIADVTAVGGVAVFGDQVVLNGDIR
ncbi:MAG: hypothetical protein AB2807_09130 [Candidatus Sedimenticola endophacoides]